MIVLFFFVKQKTAYELRISDWSSDVCSSDLSPSGEIVKLTPEIIESCIVDESFLEIVPRQTVIAVLRLKNGAVVIGEAHTLSPENFVYEVGCRVAREDAVGKIWALEGYAARNQMMERAAVREFHESLAEAARQPSEFDEFPAPDVPDGVVPPDGC